MSEEQTRQFQRYARPWWKKPEITIPSGVALVACLGSVFAFFGHIQDVWQAPVKLQKIQDIVWQDHLDIQQMKLLLNLQKYETPKERGELSSLYGTNNVATLDDTNSYQ